MERGPPTLFIICGLPASGKTTLARELEARHGALRLTPDEWMSRIVGDGWDHERRAKVEAVMTDIARRVLELGVSVVLEFGSWRRAERDALRAMAGSVSARSRTLCCDAPLEELQRRLTLRNQALPPHTFAVTAEQVAQMWPHFERPAPEEDEG